jgi:hypothetical protein
LLKNWQHPVCSGSPVCTYWFIIILLKESPAKKAGLSFKIKKEIIE